MARHTRHNVVTVTPVTSVTSRHTPLKGCDGVTVTRSADVLEAELIQLREALGSACGGDETRILWMIDSRQMELAAIRCGRAAGPVITSGAFRYPSHRWATPRSDR